MIRLAIQITLLALFALMWVSCAEDDAAANGTDAPAPVAAPAPKITEKETDPTQDSDPSKSTEESADDAGVEAERVVLSDPPKVNELAQLASLLKRRSKALDLREREVTEREQMLSGLEASTMKQVDSLFKLKADVGVLMEKLRKDFEGERKAFDEKQQQEAAEKRKKEKEAAAAAEAEAAKRLKLTQEMAAEREQRTVQLTAAVKGMRASSGASMLSSMDEADAVAVLRQLGARQAASLLNNMTPQKAAVLAAAMLGPKPTAALLDAPPTEPAQAPEGKKP